MDTVVSLTLVKWETVSGQFGAISPKPNTHLGSEFLGPGGLGVSGDGELPGRA